MRGTCTVKQQWSIKQVLISNVLNTLTVHSIPAILGKCVQKLNHCASNLAQSKKRQGINIMFSLLAVNLSYPSQYSPEKDDQFSHISSYVNKEIGTIKIITRCLRGYRGPGYFMSIPMQYIETREWYITLAICMLISEMVERHTCFYQDPILEENLQPFQGYALQGEPVITTQCKVANQGHQGRTNDLASPQFQNQNQQSWRTLMNQSHCWHY